MKKFRWDAKYLYWGITTFCVVICSITFFLVISNWSTVAVILRTALRILSPIIYGLMFAYLLNKIMTFLENAFLSKLFAKSKKPNRAPKLMRVLSVLLTVIIALIFTIGTLILILPQIFSSLKSLAVALPGYFDIVSDSISGLITNHPDIEAMVVRLVGNLSDWLTNWIQTTFIAQVEAIVSNILSGVLSVIITVTNIIIGFIISIYIIYHKERFSAQAKRIVYGIFNTRRANTIVKGVNFLDKTCGSFISGKLIDTLIVGVVCYIFMAVCRMPYAVLISVIIGITNIIPFFGPFIGGVPSALLILLESPPQCLVFIIFIVVLQQIDGNIIYPQIQGNSIGLSGFWVMFSILFFGGIFGFWGMMFGVPLFAVIYAIIKSINTTQLENRGLPSNTDDYKNIFIFSESTNMPIYKTPIEKPKKPVKSKKPNTKPDTRGDNSNDKSGNNSN